MKGYNSYTHLKNKYKQDTLNKFNKYIDSIYELNNLSGVSFLSNILIRNTFVSKIFPIIEDINIRRISEKLKSEGKSVLPLPSTRSIKTNMGAKMKFFLFLALQLFVNLLCQTRSKQSYNKSIFLEIFDGGDPGELAKHYYPNLYKKLKVSLRNEIGYFINSYQINSPLNFINLIQKIKTADFASIFYDLEIKANHIKQYFKDSSKISSEFRNIPDFLGVDMRSYVKDVLESEIYSRTNFYAICKFYIFREDEKFKDGSVLVLWNENHAYDRAICLANSLRKVKIKLIGLQGFVEIPSKNCFNLSSYEKNNNLAPDRIYKVCKKVVDTDSFHAPAFRHENFFDNQLAEKLGHKILVAFPLPPDDKAILNLVKIGESLISHGYQITYKMHPLQNKDHIRLIEDRLKTFRKFNKDEDIKVLITSGYSGIALDYFFKGIPIVNFSENITNFDNNVLRDASEYLKVQNNKGNDYYCETADPERVIDFINKLKPVSSTDIILLQRLFIKPDSVNIEEFFEDIKQT